MADESQMVLLFQNLIGNESKPGKGSVFYFTLMKRAS